jgi:hypothetical protein
MALTTTSLAATSLASAALAAALAAAALGLAHPCRRYHRLRLRSHPLYHRRQLL